MWKKTNRFQPQSPEQIMEKKLKSFRKQRDAADVARSVGITIVVFFILCQVLMGLGMVRGESMRPILQDKDIILFWRINSEYERGEIVFLESNTEGKDLVKRVVGVPGDVVDITGDGTVQINGEAIEEEDIFQETYLNNEEVLFSYPVTLGSNEYFVLGDNRAVSRDSRVIGAVTKKEIKGKVIAHLHLGE